MLAPKTYLPVINSLRGLAATAICFYHFVLSTANYVEEPWVRTVFYYAQYGVPLFFVISGIVLPLAMLKNEYQLQHWATFMTKRLVRLEPPYLVSLVFATAYLIFQTYRHTGLLEFSVVNFLLHLGYLIPLVEGQKWINPIYWSLAVEFQFYLFLSLAFTGLRQLFFSRRFLVYILMLSACFISTEKAFVFRWLPLFLVGIIYVLKQHKIIEFKEYIIVSFVSFGLIYYLLDFPNLCVAIFTLSVVHYFPTYNPKCSNFLGKISYSLYLIHLIIGQALVNFLSHTYRLPYQKIIVILLAYVLSVFAAWLLYKWIEQPSKQASSKLKYTTIES
jgi:peptidoglycan/LPS O-acetylase OafA/YrhL